MTYHVYIIIITIILLFLLIALLVCYAQKPSKRKESRTSPPPNTSPPTDRYEFSPRRYHPKRPAIIIIHIIRVYHHRLALTSYNMGTRIIVLVPKSYYVCDAYYNMFIMITSSSFCVAKWIQFTGDGASAAQ